MIGEYGYLSTSRGTEELLCFLMEAMERPHDEPSTRYWILTAIMKIVAHEPNQFDLVGDVASRYQKSMLTDIQQRAHEFVELAKVPATMEAVLPKHSYAEAVFPCFILLIIDSGI